MKPFPIWCDMCAKQNECHIADTVPKCYEPKQTEPSRDAERMLEVMDRTVHRADIWQDRCVYWIAVAVYHLICEVKKLKRSDQ